MTRRTLGAVLLLATVFAGDRLAARRHIESVAAQSPRPSDRSQHRSRNFVPRSTDASSHRRRDQRDPLVSVEVLTADNITVERPSTASAARSRVQSTGNSCRRSMPAGSVEQLSTVPSAQLRATTAARSTASRARKPSARARCRRRGATDQRGRVAAGGDHRQRARRHHRLLRPARVEHQRARPGARRRTSVLPRRQPGAVHQRQINSRDGRPPRRRGRRDHQGHGARRRAVPGDHGHDRGDPGRHRLVRAQRRAHHHAIARRPVRRARRRHRPARRGRRLRAPRTGSRGSTPAATTPRSATADTPTASTPTATSTS